MSSSIKSNDVLYNIDAVEDYVCSFDEEFFKLSFQDVAHHTQIDVTYL